MTTPTKDLPDKWHSETPTPSTPNEAYMIKAAQDDELVMREILKAPWTDEQVDALDARQQRDDLHPYTCPRCSHSLEPFNNGWQCAERCGYTQDWCHAADADIGLHPPELNWPEHKLDGVADCQNIAESKWQAEKQRADKLQAKLEAVRGLQRYDMDVMEPWRIQYTTESFGDWIKADDLESVLED
jgi:hypothetical protein